MARDFNGSTQYARRTPALVTAPPFTVSCWFNYDTLPNPNPNLIGMIGPSFEGFYLYVGDGDATLKLLTFSGGGSGEAVAAAAAGSSGTWYHAVGVSSAANSRAVYLNGGNKGTNTTSVTPAGVADFCVGAWFEPTSLDGGHWDGRIAEVALWNVALTDDEAASLAKGAYPPRVRPASLVGYWPLWGRYSPEVDIAGGANLTLTASPAAAAHKMGQRGNRRRRVYVLAGGGGVTTNPSPVTATAAVTSGFGYSLTQGRTAVTGAGSVVNPVALVRQAGAAVTGAGTVVAPGQRVQSSPGVIQAAGSPAAGSTALNLALAPVTAAGSVVTPAHSTGGSPPVTTEPAVVTSVGSVVTPATTLELELGDGSIFATAGGVTPATSLQAAPAPVTGTGTIPVPTPVVTAGYSPVTLVSGVVDPTGGIAPGPGPVGLTGGVTGAATTLTLALGDGSILATAAVVTPVHSLGEFAPPGGWVVAGAVYLPGAAVGGVFLPGAVAGGVYTPGTPAGGGP